MTDATPLSCFACSLRRRAQTITQISKSKRRSRHTMPPTMPPIRAASNADALSVASTRTSAVELSAAVSDERIAVVDVESTSGNVGCRSIIDEAVVKESSVVVAVDGEFDVAVVVTSAIIDVVISSRGIVDREVVGGICAKVG